MNNILSYNDYFKDLESLVYTNEVNEGTGIRGFFNKRAGKKVAAQLSEEIEMSKSIMDGISKGLDSLNDEFEAIKQDIEKKDDGLKGEKKKKLDGITKIIEDSRKQTWDLNELIDEGEIDYSGFTANAGLALVTYFGILLFPVRTSVIIHKGYNYFFTLVKNTIRKSLVMLQLNFDQFENLIIYQSFVSADYIRDMDMASEIATFYERMEQSLFNDKNGSLKNTRGHDKLEKQMKAFKDKFDAEMKMNKSRRESNPYTMLDSYNNTYTKSLESLRQYSQDDVQKQLDGIKNSMNKLAGGDVDLQAFGEFIIAAAEEHAYKVSSSIYNKFAKMSEVFSLPNQKKMIELIQDATAEDEKKKSEIEAKKKKEIEKKFSEEKADKFEKEGSDIFKSLSGAKLGDYDKENRKYKDIDGSVWTYEEFEKLDDDKQDIIERWLQVHKEVWDKCDKTLQVSIPIPCGSTDSGYFEYIDALIDYISPCLVIKESNENILNFDNYVLNEKKSSKKYILNLSKSRDQIENIKVLFKKNKENAKVALKVIGKKFARNSFYENADKIVSIIKQALSDREYKVGISDSTYNILSDTITILKDARNHDYASLGNEESNKEKSEK